MTTQQPDQATPTDPASELAATGTAAPAQASAAGEQDGITVPAAPRARVAMLSLGGTIFMTQDLTGLRATPDASIGADLSRTLIDGVAVTHTEVANVGSPSVTAAHLRDVLELARRAVDDGAAGVVAPFVAELLGWPVLTNLTELSIDGDSVRATQASETATAELSAQLPAVVSVADGFADPRYPNFKGLMAAKKKELNTVSLAELGVDPEDFTHPRAIMVDIERRPERERGEIIDGNSTAATRLVDFLESKNLI